MKVYDLAVIGSGMGGAMIAALNKDKSHILFERDKNLGGCASNFKRFGALFNAGATTLVGYEENHVLKRIFDKVGAKPDLLGSDIAFQTIQGNKKLNRYKDFDKFLKELNETYPNANNESFWRKIKEIDKKFWSLKNIHFAKYSFSSYIRTLKSVVEVFTAFKFDLFKSATSFIKDELGDISQEYQNFIDAQLYITVQTTSEHIPLLTMCLGLAYPFHDVSYVNGGMGKVFDELLKDVNVHNKEEVIKISKEDDAYLLLTNKCTYKAKKVVLNSTIYDSKNFFDKGKIQDYYNSYEVFDQSAFVVYIKLNIKKEFLHHYQIILKENIPNCISNAFFVSISDEKDEVLSKNGLSITISTHTRALYWKNLEKQEYEKQKQITQDFILKEFLYYFASIKEEDIKKVFSASSHTFNSYLGRYNCGGSRITFSNILKFPSCNTPFKNLYNVGDTVFAGQGWPGVSLGVEVLNKEINEKF